MNKFAYSRYYDIDFLYHFPKKDSYYLLILNLVNLTNCKFFLELGIGEDENHIKLLKPFIDLYVGVDIDTSKININDKNIIIYNTTTDNFFIENKRKFDIIFIDGDHRYEQVKIDFENSLKILNKFGIIIFHDTDPIHKRLLVDGYCSTSFKIIDYIYVKHPELNIITLPINEMGLSIVMKRDDRRIFYNE
jgi:hypothetical protein